MLERDFGPGFAAYVAKLPTGDWYGPIESVHGWHLVQVSRRQDSPAVRFEDVQERVASDLAHSTDNPSSDAAYARMRARYTVEIQGVGQQ
jgi:parvulin-like peptidyl-prolyl isomerase